MDVWRYAGRFGSDQQRAPWCAAWPQRLRPGQHPKRVISLGRCERRGQGTWLRRLCHPREAAPAHRRRSWSTVST